MSWLLPTEPTSYWGVLKALKRSLNVSFLSFLKNLKANIPGFPGANIITQRHFVVGHRIFGKTDHQTWQRNPLSSPFPRQLRIFSPRFIKANTLPELQGLPWPSKGRVVNHIAPKPAVIVAAGVGVATDNLTWSKTWKEIYEWGGDQGSKQSGSWQNDHNSSSTFCNQCWLLALSPFNSTP